MTINEITVKYKILAAGVGTKEHKQSTFEKAIANKKFRSTKSGRQVKFSSLPLEQQKSIRRIFNKHYKGAEGHGGRSKSAFNAWHKENHYDPTSKENLMGPNVKKSQPKSPPSKKPTRRSRSTPTWDPDEGLFNRKQTEGGVVGNPDHWARSGPRTSFKTEHGTYTRNVHDGKLRFTGNDRKRTELGTPTDSGLGPDDNSADLARRHHETLSSKKGSPPSKRKHWSEYE